MYIKQGLRKATKIMNRLREIHRCDPGADKIRLILFDGADPYPTVSNVFYDSQPGTSVDLDDFVPVVTMDPGALNMRPF